MRQRFLKEKRKEVLYFILNDENQKVKKRIFNTLLFYPKLRKLLLGVLMAQMVVLLRRNLFQIL